MVCCLSPHAKLVGDGGNTVEFSSYISLMVLAAINVCVFMPLIRKNRSLPNGTMQTSDCSLVIDRAKSDYSIVVQFRNRGTICPLGIANAFLLHLHSDNSNPSGDCLIDLYYESAKVHIIFSICCSNYKIHSVNYAAKQQAYFVLNHIIQSHIFSPL